jgi:hypothetical protein
MPIDAFIMRHAGGIPFAESFLQSQDFELDGITAIARRVGAPTAIRGRDQLIQYVAYELNRRQDNYIHDEILKQLVARKKTWMSVKIGSIGPSFQGRDPSELIYSGGDAQWYGPLSHPDDDVAALWYIRPHFRKHGEVSSDRRTIEQVYIRWLVFARVLGDAVSFHWRGFSHLPIEDDVTEDGASTRNVQFGYWYHIPGFFDEIEKLLDAEVKHVNLQQVVLHRLWDTYLSLPDYQWSIALLCDLGSKVVYCGLW